MYTITLEVNHICNFHCRYCYLGEKTGEIMSRETALKGLEIAFMNAQHHRDRRLWIDFVGGETLISFGIIKELSEYIERKAEKKNMNVTYSITTNGSIMDTEIYKWLVEKKVHIKLSIDGTEETHNRNRILKKGQGTYGIIQEKLPFFRQYENITGIKIQGTHVITKNNYMEFFLSIKHLVEEIGLNIVDSSIDLFCQWSYEELQIIVEEWRKIIQYYNDRAKIGKPFLWGMLFDMQKYEKERELCSLCGVGMKQIYIRTNGDIYGCAANLKSTGKLGDVERGINITRLRRHQQINQESAACEKCDAQTKCTVKGCIMNHLYFSGNAGIPNDMMCFLERKKQELWRDSYIHFGIAVK